MKIVERENPQAKGCWDKINKQIKRGKSGTAGEPRERPFMGKFVCYNRSLPGWRYRLGVRTEDSQSSNTGSIPVSATNISLDITKNRSSQVPMAVKMQEIKQSCC
jgi:hypothetical protein